MTITIMTVRWSDQIYGRVHAASGNVMVMTNTLVCAMASVTYKNLQMLTIADVFTPADESGRMFPL